MLSSLNARITWLMRLRSLVAGLQLLALPLVLQARLMPSDRWGLYLALVLFLPGFNLLLRWAHAQDDWQHPGWLWGQLSIDTLQLVLLLWITGGYLNPFSALLFIHAALGGILLLQFWSILHLLILGLGIGWLHSTALMTPVIDRFGLSVGLSSQLLVALALWGLTRWLAQLMAESHQQLTALREKSQSRERLRVLGALAAGFSHEFATPLNTLHLRLARLERQYPEASDIPPMHHALERCTQILRQMVGVTPEGAEEVEVQISFATLLPPILTAWQQEHPDTPLEWSPGPGWDEILLLPRLALTQALFNLLDNGHEAAPGKPLSLTLTLTTEEIRLQVMDRGPGWPDVVRRQWGEPFVTTKDDGTGLGLYSTGLVAQSLGGELSIGDRDGGGAWVCLRWPR
jgi:two-component system sensor histidine kinase RegB